MLSQGPRTDRTPFLALRDVACGSVSGRSPPLGSVAERGGQRFARTHTSGVEVTPGTGVLGLLRHLGLRVRHSVPHLLMYVQMHGFTDCGRF